MRVRDMNWMQVAEYLKYDDRAVVPIGSTEQHAQLSLMVDCILAERVSEEAAEPLHVPVFPTVNYGVAPYFLAFPGTVSLRTQTLLNIVEDIFSSLSKQGFRRILLVNGHGGNAPAQELARDWQADHPSIQIKFHNWWKAPRTWAKVQALDPVASHASWMENFPWTRLTDVTAPAQRKAPVDFKVTPDRTAAEIRALLDDGSFGGDYQRPDEDMAALWHEAVGETRELLESAWGDIQNGR